MVSGYSMTMHSSVLAALHDHGGSLRASFSLGADGRTIGAPLTHNRRRRCSGCDEYGHDLKRCNGPGKPPREYSPNTRRAR